MKAKWWFVISLSLGAVILLSLPAVVREMAYANEKGKAEAAREVLTDEQLRVATHLSEAFQRVSDAVAPAVVSVKSTKTIQFVTRDRRIPPELKEGPLRRFFGEEFFQQQDPNASPRQRFQRHGNGSGVVISEDGYILTNNHVISGSDSVKVVLSGGKKYEASVVGTDPKTDLAVLKIDASGLVFAPLGDSDALRVGEWVLAIGNPFNLNQTVTAGILSATGRANVGIADYENFLQTDAAINPGNSGGPLVNLKGEVIGINTAIATRTGQYAGIGFAIPVNMVRKIKDSLIANGHVQRGYMGVIIQNLDDDLAKSFNFKGTDGVLIGDVMTGGPADAAGLKSGDIITKYNGEAMKNVQQLRNTVAATSPGTKVDVEVTRNGSSETLHLKVGELESKAVPIAQSAPKREVSEDLGLTVRALTPEISEALGMPPSSKGVTIEKVEAGSLAAFAGLEKRDVITSINDQPVRSLEDFNAELNKHNLHQGIRLHVKSKNGSRFVFLKND